MVFHRILDFKTRLDFYPASIFLPPADQLFTPSDQHDLLIQ